MSVQAAIMYLALVGLVLTGLPFVFCICGRILSRALEKLRLKVGVVGLFVMFAVVTVTTIKAQKTGDAGNSTNDAPSQLFGMLNWVSSNSGSPENSVTNLSFSGVCPQSGGVTLSLAWPLEQRRNIIELFASTNLFKSAWVRIFSRTLPWWAHTNVVAEIAFDRNFPFGADPSQLFLRAGWHADTDNDGLTDLEELLVYKTNPSAPDSDGDGLYDGEEIDIGTLPLDPDSDGDGFVDGWDSLYFDALTNNTDVATVDYDGDGLTNIEEAYYGTNPNSRDTDWDMLDDKWEIDHGLDPLDSQYDQGLDGDPDLDGMVNVNEEYYGTDPHNPDSDGDGLWDGIDANPMTWDGDYSGPHQSISERANTNAYYWIDITAVGTNAMVRCIGDGTSDLADPSFVVFAGATNRVMLLIGKPYEISCRQRIEIIATSDDRVEVSDGPDSIRVCWPVTIDVTAVNTDPALASGYGAPHIPTSFVMDVSPSCLGGGFVWTNCCCDISGYNGLYVLTCDSGCACLGCTTSGYYSYEGYRLPARGASCGCTPENYNPGGGDVEWGPYSAGVSVSFSADAVIFEDAYTNRPGEVVNRQSTHTVLSCVVAGGVRGGMVTFTPSEDDKLAYLDGNVMSLPTGTVAVPAGAQITYWLEYEGFLPSSSKDDIIVSGRFVENGTGEVFNSDDRVTSVQIMMDADADWPSNKVRHVFGPKEKVYVRTPGLNAALRLIGSMPYHGLVSYDSDGWYFIVPDQPISFCLYAKVGNAVFPIDFSCEGPTAVHALSVRAWRNDEWTELGIPPFSSEEAGVTAFIQTFLVPQYVSFEHLRLFEGYAPPVSRQGWYLDLVRFPDALLEHSAEAGASADPGSTYVTVGSDNLIEGGDYVGGWIGAASTFTNGSYCVNIPMSWFVEGGSQTNVLAYNEQKLWIFDNGSMRIRKYGVSWQRDLDGLQYIPGGGE